MQWIKTHREKQVVIIGVFSLLALTIYHFAIEPVLDRNRNLERIFIEKQSALNEMAVLEHTIKDLNLRLHDKSGDLKIAPANFSLFAFLDAQARVTGVKEQVVYMKPSEKKMENNDLGYSIVKVKVSKIYLKKLIDFLKRIETNRNGVALYSLSLNRSGKKERTLDAIFEARVLKKLNKE